MEFEKKNKLKKKLFRISKTVYFILSLYSIALGSYLILVNPPFKTIEERTLYFITVSCIGVAVFISWVFLIFSDYKEEVKNE
jgi:uncharacterized Tic20 family protein